jgi:hypothetical protein
LEGIRATELALERHRKEYARTAVDEHAVPAEELQSLRAHRETGWSIIRLKYIEGGAVPDAQVEAYSDGGSLTDAYRTAVDDADEAADRRFETAQATARLAEIARQSSEQEEHLDELRGLERGYRSDRESLSREWLELWREAPFAPAPPDDMLVWLAARAHVVQALERRLAAEREAASLRDEESKAKDLLIGELAKLGTDAGRLAARPFRAVVEAAAELVRKHEADIAARRKFEDVRKTTDTDVSRKQKALEAAEAELSGWTDDWIAAVTLLGLDPNDAPETIEAQIEAIGEMREVGNRIEDLRRERIGKIERDIAAFDAEVAATVASVAPDLVGADCEEAVVELERRLEEADQIRRTASDLDARLVAENKKVEECDGVRRGAVEAVERLQNEAGVTSVDDLRAVIARSDELRSLRGEQTALRTSLAQSGDGKLLAELAEECAGADLDQTSAGEQTVSQELADLRGRLVELGETRASARREFEAVAGAATADLAQRSDCDHL